MRVRVRNGRARAGQGAMPRVHAAAPRERMSSSNQIIYLVPLHLAPDSREALAEVGEVRVVLGLRGLDLLDVVADDDRLSAPKTGDVEVVEAPLRRFSLES